MAFLDNFLGMLSRELNNIFWAPSVVQEQQTQSQTESQQVLMPTPVAIQTSGWGFNWINDRDFSPVGLTWVANQWFPLAQMNTPQNSQFRIMKGEKRVRIYLKGQFTTTGQNLTTATATTVNLPFLVQTPRAEPSLPNTYFPDVSVWTQVNGVWQQLTITGVAYPNGVTVGTVGTSSTSSSSNVPTGSVTFTEPAGITGNIYIYYTHSDGEMRFRVARDTGGVDDSSATYSTSPSQLST